MAYRTANYLITTTYKHGYQGQFTEKDEEVNWDAFELRNWDGRLARWTSIDPYHQHWSPYLGMGNNPINLTDPDGGKTDHWKVENGKATLLDTKGDNIYVNDVLISDFNFTGQEGALAQIGTHYYNTFFSSNFYHLAGGEASVFSFENGQFDGAYNSPNTVENMAVMSVHPAKISADGLNHLNLYEDGGFVSSKLNNKYNFINNIAHERTHFIQGGGASIINELEAYNVQTNHWSFGKTTSSHKSFIRSNVSDYLKDLRYNGFSNPTIRSIYKPYYQNNYNHYNSIFND